VPGETAAARRPLRELMDDRLLDALLERSRDQAGGLRLTGEGSMLGELVRAVLERALPNPLTAAQHIPIRPRPTRREHPHRRRAHPRHPPPDKSQNVSAVAHVHRLARHQPKQPHGAEQTFRCWFGERSVLAGHGQVYGEPAGVEQRLRVRAGTPGADADGQPSFAELIEERRDAGHRRHRFPGQGTARRSQVGTPGRREPVVADQDPQRLFV
jgi:hypothetical protein